MLNHVESGVAWGLKGFKYNVTFFFLQELKMPEHLFQDSFIVIGLDPDGKKFDKGNFRVTDMVELIYFRRRIIALCVLVLCVWCL